MIEALLPLFLDGLAQFRFTTTEVGLIAAGAVFVTLLLVGAVAFALDVEVRGSEQMGPTIDDPDEVKLEGDEKVRLSEVSVEDEDGSLLIQDDPLWIDGYRSFIGEWYAARRRRKKRRKLAKKGYVEWRLVDGTFPTPTFVKPKRTGSGIPQYEHNGVSYIFPEGAAIPSEQSGMRTYVHKVGEMDPINMRDPVDHSIPPDAHQEYSEMDIQTASPGWLGSMSAGDMLFYGLVGIIILAVGWSALQGGLV